VRPGRARGRETREHIERARPEMSGRAGAEHLALHLVAEPPLDRAIRVGMGPGDPSVTRCESIDRVGTSIDRSILVHQRWIDARRRIDACVDIDA
jgi:hypothetical protein